MVGIGDSHGYLELGERRSRSKIPFETTKRPT